MDIIMSVGDYVQLEKMQCILFSDQKWIIVSTEKTQKEVSHSSHS